MKKMRWGLLGSGRLLNRWLKGFRQVEDAEIAGIASRTIETAKRRAMELGISDYMTYDEMLRRDDIDIIYIAVPHPAHKELAIRAMNAGFPVLVEKPAAVTAADWDEMTEAARKNRVFLMEAVWTRCFPAIIQMMDEIRAGKIGEVRCVQAAFAFRVADDYQGRLTDPMDAGGALLDTGVYNLHFAQMVYGRSPLRWASLASIGTDELHLQVDEQAAYVGQYENGALSILSSAIRTSMPDTAWVYGTKGMIRIPVYWKATEIEFRIGSETEMISVPVPQRIPETPDEGFQYEIIHVQDCIRHGMLESPLVPQGDTRAVLAQCDELRNQWDLRYPFEGITGQSEDQQVSEKKPGSKKSFMANFAAHFFAFWDKPSEEATEERLKKLLKEEEKPSPSPIGLRSRFTDSPNGRVFYLNEQTAAPVTVFYIHGGGYQDDFSPFHWKYIKTIIDRTGAKVIAPAYRLIPYASCTDAFALIEPLYKDYAEKHPEEKLILMGDSAGGGLALALAQHFKARGIRNPDELILISPWLDVTFSNPEIGKYQSKDPWLTIPWLSVCGRWWSKDLDPKDPRVSPIFGDMKGLRNVTVSVGTNEIFYPDIKKFFGMLDPAKGNELIVGEDLNHVFPLMPIPEAKPAEDKFCSRILRWHQG